MNLTLIRHNFTDKSTEGELFNGAEHLCFTLELPNKDGRPGSCIPQGTYPIIITPSPKFDREMPLLLNVPGRSAIRIHWGNDEVDTEGCILVGLTQEADFIGRSRDAFAALWSLIEVSARAGDLSISILGGASNPNTETPR